MMSENYSTLHFVEDSDDEVFLSRILFENESIETTIIHSPNFDHLLDVLDLKADNEITHSLIVVDMNLPEMRGTEIIKKLRTMSRYQKLTIGICSGSEDPADVKAAFDNGADFFVAKPLNRYCLQKICSVALAIELVETADGYFNLKHTF